jgi:hypothetical protein
MGLPSRPPPVAPAVSTVEFENYTMASEGRFKPNAPIAPFFRIEIRSDFSLAFRLIRSKPSQKSKTNTATESLDYFQGGLMLPMPPAAVFDFVRTAPDIQRTEIIVNGVRTMERCGYGKAVLYSVSGESVKKRFENSRWSIIGHQQGNRRKENPKYEGSDCLTLSDPG